MNEQNKIRIGGMDYSLPFLQSLLDTVRGEYPSFSADMLKVWEDNEREELRKSESDLDAQQREAAERLARHNEEKMIRDDG